MRCSPMTEKVKLHQEALTCSTGTVLGIKADLPNFDCVNGYTACDMILKMSILM